jgi:hypothetical protein
MINAEQLEAEQEALNQKNRELIEALSEEEREKYQAVGEALQILSRAGVQSILFSILPLPEGHTSPFEKETCFQHNNCMEVNKPVNGVFTSENYIEMSRFNHMFIRAVINYFAGMTKQTTSLDFNLIFNVLYQCFIAWEEWLKNGTPPPDIQKFLTKPHD